MRERGLRPLRLLPRFLPMIVAVSHGTGLSDLAD
jgi:hypothetical protein